MQIGAFEILDTIGAGTSGVVYRARHVGLGRVVALKQLARVERQGDQAFERFKREAQMMAAIRSNHVVTLYGFHAIDGRGYLEMECLPGSLQTVLEAGPLGTEQALDVIRQVLLGLKALHAQDIIHRDIKPGNVLQDADGTLKLGDFGLSIFEGSAAPTLHAATIRYVAPESVSDRPSWNVKSDLYSAGMMLYEAVLGSEGLARAFPDLAPIEANPGRWLNWLRDLSREAPPLHQVRPDVPIAVSQFVARLMIKDPDLRTESAEVALEALATLDARPAPNDVRAGGRARIVVPNSGPAPRADTPAHPPVPVTPPTPVSRRGSGWRYAAFGVGFVVLAIGATWLGAFLRRPQTSPTSQNAPAPSSATPAEATTPTPPVTTTPTTTATVQPDPSGSGDSSASVTLPGGDVALASGTVSIPAGLLMDANEVTAAAFATFIRTNARWRKENVPPMAHDGDYLKDWVDGAPPAAHASHPITYVTWDAALAFCQGRGGRLPTEAEWEFAARAGSSAAYWWGPDFDPARANAGGAGTQSVGQPAHRNAYGLFDAAGNVWEWTASGERGDKIVRGGGWQDDPRFLQLDSRQRLASTVTAPDLGFRCVTSGGR